MHSFWTPAPLRKYIYTHIYTRSIHTYLRPHAEIRGNKIIKNKNRIPRYNPRRAYILFFLFTSRVFCPSRDWRLYIHTTLCTNTIIVYIIYIRIYNMCCIQTTYVLAPAPVARGTSANTWLECPKRSGPLRRGFAEPAVAGAGYIGINRVLQLHSTAAAAATGLKVYQLFFFFFIRRTRPCTRTYIYIRCMWCSCQGMRVTRLRIVRSPRGNPGAFFTTTRARSLPLAAAHRRRRRNSYYTHIR